MIKAAFIGTGGISGVHLKFLKSREDVQIAGLCDVNKDNLKKRQDEFGGQGFSDFIEMLDSVKPDCVWICTPPQVRKDPLIACADLGIPVMYEKPVERTVDKAKAINAALKKRKAKVQVGYVFRSTPSIIKLRETMADDKIHLIQSIYCCDMSLTRSFPAWFYKKEISGGALIDQATHNLDLIRVLMGEVNDVRGFASNPVTSKKGEYTVDETLAISYLFKNKAVGTHLHTWVGDSWRNEMLLSGEKRKYHINLFSGVLTVDEKGKVDTFKQGDTPIHDYQNKIFLDMVKSGDWSKNPCTYEDGLKTLELTIKSDAAMG